MKPTDVIVIPGFATQDECRALAAWAQTEYSAGRLTLWQRSHFIGGYRVYDPDNGVWEADDYGRVLQPLQNIPPEYLALRSRINDALGLQAHEPRKTSASLLIVSLPGGFTTSHKDGSVDGFKHMRCNVNVLPPGEGGNLIVEGKEYPLGEGDLICFVADVMEHEATVNTGSTPRITVSYPFIMPDEWFS